MDFADSTEKTAVLYRRLLALAAAVYLLWWPAVAAVLPKSYNPLGSRLAVVGFLVFFAGFTYVNKWAKNNSRLLFQIGIWIITLHYYYLFYNNDGDINWVVGDFITITATTFAMTSSRALISYTIFVTLLSAGMVFVLPQLRESVFLPGLITILIQANIGLKARLQTISNLAESNEHFQLLFDSTFEGIIVHQNLKIVSANEALCQILGYASPAELFGRDALAIFVAEDRQMILDKIKSRYIISEMRGLKRNGDTVDLEVRGKDFMYNHAPARLVTIQDLSDRKKAEQQRIAALTLAENVRVRDEFISIASHELKTPISSLQIQNSIIERQLRKGHALSTEEANDAISMFKRQIHRLTEMVDSMLDVSRISSGRFTLEPIDFDIAELVREIAATPRPQSAEITVLGPEHLKIRGDRRRLEQVIENLVSNAIKYGDGKPIRVALSLEASQVVVVVEDHGIGISPEFIPRLFTRFERAISARNISGLGLGLYIAKQIVEGHGGSITVDSRFGSGSAFTVRLPISA